MTPDTMTGLHNWYKGKPTEFANLQETILQLAKVYASLTGTISDLGILIERQEDADPAMNTT